MNKLTTTFSEMHPAAQIAVGVAVSAAVVATGGALAYAIATYGAVFTSGTGLVAVGPVARAFAEVAAKAVVRRLALRGTSQLEP